MLKNFNHNTHNLDKDIDTILDELDFIAQQLKESGAKLSRVYSEDSGRDSSLIFKMKEFDKHFQICNESLNDFTENAKKLLNINNLRNFQWLGYYFKHHYYRLAKFGKPEKNQE